jgi:glycine betaine/proline transport system permease protein
VPRETVEAAHAFGATPGQTLIKVELPLALPTIMAGVNQVIMLALSMVVIAALIGGGGLGAVVVTGLSQLDVGKGFVGGLAIVIIAMVLDRVTRNVTTRNARGVRRVIRLHRAAPPKAPAGSAVGRSVS